mgnify:CR=1 FL=1
MIYSCLLILVYNHFYIYTHHNNITQKLNLLLKNSSTSLMLESILTYGRIRFITDSSLKFVYLEYRIKNLNNLDDVNNSNISNLNLASSFR